MSRGIFRISRAALLAGFVALAISPLSAEDMAEDFVYLRDVDPSIEQDMRYAGSDNFTTRSVPGYDAPECVLVREVAGALRAAQAELKPVGLALKVYDCYRPAQAVAAFVAWAKEPDNLEAKRSYYPNLAKSALFPDYIATKSGHSRGATVDLTLVTLDTPPEAHSTGTADSAACDASEASGNGLDMGTGFDCFDPKANTDTPNLPPEQRRNRELLVEVMSRHGFENYPKEFWHYTFRPEPYPDTYFDFPIAPRSNGGKG
jgi:D-alanyl-D-alanine dipeptidase